jgi:hypothetical protein
VVQVVEADKARNFKSGNRKEFKDPRQDSRQH